MLNFPERYFADPLDTRTRPLPNGQVVAPVDFVHERARRGLPGVSLAWFVRKFWPVLEPSTPLQWNWHMDVLCMYLQRQLLGLASKPDLMINVPPGTSKSLITAVFAPAWLWSYRPATRILAASGNPAVVTRDSIRCRNLITSTEYRAAFAPSWKLSSDQNEKQYYYNTASGWRRGVGAGGAVTGDRADWILVDDPNDAQGVHSKATRLNINEQWWRDAMSNRIADPKTAHRTLIMQRLHEEDLAGYIRSYEGDQWEQLVLRMTAEAGDPERAPEDRRTPGELLFPARFDAVFLSREAKKGSAYMAGQHQQRPVDARGEVFERGWWQFWSRTGEVVGQRPTGVTVAPPRRWCPEIDPRQHSERFRYRLVQSVDATFKDASTSDNVAVSMLAQEGPRWYLLEAEVRAMGYNETVRVIRAQRERWPACRATVIEDKANGSAIIETLQGELEGVVAVNPMGGKEARAAAVAPTVEAGQVYLPEGWEGSGAWVDEFASFPRGKHDDRVDCLSQVLLWAQTDGAGEDATLALLGRS